MGTINGLVPARFLTIVTHFIITIVIFLSRDENILACLPMNYTDAEYDSKSTQLLVGLILTLVFLAIESFCFLSGITMFMPTQNILFYTALVAHSSASISLSYFVVERWSADVFLPIFVACTALPTIMDSLLVTRQVVFLTPPMPK